MSKIIDLKEERKKEKRKNLIMKLIFIVVAIYILYVIYLILKTPTDTMTVETGILTEEEAAIGYIIRDETVIKGNNYKNGIYQILSEGEKAAKNQTIFRYYGKSEDELQEKINDVNIKIQEAVEKEKSSILLSDVKKLETQIDDKIKTLSKQTDIQTISEYKKYISELMLKKALILGESSQSGSYIKNLMSQKEQYESELEKGSEYIKATESGILSYRVDGFEEILGTNNFENLLTQDLEDLDIKTGKTIPESNESGKIIYNFGCYIATTLDSDTAKNAEVGDKIKITFASGDEKTAQIYKINEEDDGKRLIILKIDSITEELISYRKISFNITWWSYSGIKVPNHAIIEDENGLKYVVRKTTTGTEKVLVKLLKKNERNSVIGTYSAEDLKELSVDINNYRGISTYDTIMLYPE